MKVKDVEFKPGDRIRELTRTVYEVLSVKPFKGCSICEGCGGMTVYMEIQRVFKNGKRGEIDCVFGTDIFLFSKVDSW